MSSREIAALTGKEHFHVCRDIRSMLVQLYGGSDANYSRNPNLEYEIKQCVRCYRYDDENPNAWEYALDRKHTECLITGYDAGRRMAVIDRWLQLETRQAPQLNSDQVQAGIMLLESAKRTLNLSNSSMLRGYQQIHAATGLPDLLPVYAIDAPADAVDGSSRSTSALRTLLQQRDFPLKVQAAYQRLQELGIVQRMTRPSTKGEKQFWSITPSGLMFGKNMTSPGNPRETQPHFYDSRADELVAMILGDAK